MMNKADMILKSTAIYTGVGAPISGIVAIHQDKIQYVGTMDRMEELVGEHTRVIDLKNQLITPGLNDAHMHFYIGALYESPYFFNRTNQTSEEQCVRELAPHAAKIPKDRWLIGTGWYHNLWDVPVLPTKKSLDAVYPDRPVCMVSCDCHTLWFNSEGIKRLGLDPDHLPLDEILYDKDEKGELTGTVHDAAASLLMPKVYEFTLEEDKEILIHFMKKMNSYGITSLSDMSIMPLKGMDFVKDDIYQMLLEEGNLTVRVNMFPTLMEDLERPLTLRDRYKDSMLQCRGVKQFFDGVSCCHTAFLTQPYTNAYYPGDCGTTTMDPERMEQLVLLAQEHDFSVRVHTIGDRAIHLLLDYIEQAEKVYGKKPYLSHTLEHLENILEEDIPRLASLGVIPSVQPPHPLIDPEGVYMDLGEERVQLMWAFRTFLDAGAKLAFGTDCPVSDVNPMHALYNAVTRKDVFTKLPEAGWLPKECVTIKESLDAYTYGAACAEGRGSEYGILAPGMYADLAVFDQNLLEIDPEEILNTKAVLTIVNGTIVFDRAEETI